MVDVDGRDALSIALIVVSALFGAGSFALAFAPIIDSSHFLSIIEGAVSDISDCITYVRKVQYTAVVYAVAGTIKIAKRLSDSFDSIESQPNYRTPRELHHLVAKGASNARYARQVLQDVGIGLNSGYNLLSIKTGLHRRLHTNSYYGWANSVVISAYQAAGNDKRKQRENVLQALGAIRAFVMSLDAVAPF